MSYSAQSLIHPQDMLRNYEVLRNNLNSANEAGADPKYDNFAGKAS
jgi:hypothetical protein